MNFINHEELKCFSVFWNDNNRFKKEMIPDNALTNGYCLREHDNFYVFYMEDTDEVNYNFAGKPKSVVAVDTRKKYREIKIGRLKPGQYAFKAPYKSDRALALWKIKVLNVILSTIKREVLN